MNLYITDKTGKKFWNTSVSAGHAQGERNNLNRHLQAIKAGDRAYAKVGIDRATAVYVECCEPSLPDISDDELLSELMA